MNHPFLFHKKISQSERALAYSYVIKIAEPLKKPTYSIKYAKCERDERLKHKVKASATDKRRMMKNSRQTAK